MVFIFKCFVAFFICCSAHMVWAQEIPKSPLLAERGFIIGAGYGIDTKNVPEGKYMPVLLMAHVGIHLRRQHPIADHRGNIFTFYFEPQVNPVFIRNADRVIKDLEFGVNLGFKHMFRLYNHFYSYVLIGFGPHYMTVHTNRLARGFVFSDNFGTGIYLATKTSYAFNLGFRLRHLSNAELKKPNHGINTFNFIFGAAKILR